MKAAFFLTPFIISLTMVSCHSDSKKSEQDALVAAEQRIMHEADSTVAANTPKGQNVGSALDKFVSDFVGAHPGMMNNEHTKAVAAKQFTEEFSKWLKDGGLSGQVFKLWTVSRDGKADLMYHVANRNSTYAMTVSVSALVSKDDIERLEEGKDYRVDGTFTLNKENDGSIWNCGISEGPETINRQVIFGTIFSALNVVCKPQKFTAAETSELK